MGYAFYNHRITVDLDNRPGVRDDYMIHLEAKDKFGSESEWYSTGGPSFPDPRIEYNEGCNCFLATDEERTTCLSTIWCSRCGVETTAGMTMNKRFDCAWSAPPLLWPIIFAALMRITVRWATPLQEPASIQGNIPDGFGIFGVTNGVVVNLED